MNRSSYIAITFGPITRVISYAKSTKELWAASYLFSYLAKKVLEPFKTRTFLLPQLAEEMYDKTQTRGAGLFPDRYIFQAEDKDFDTLCETCDKLYEQLGTDIATTIKKPEKTDAITDYLKRTIKIYCIEKEFSNNEDVVDLCEKLLGGMELQDLFPQKEPCNYLSRFFKEVNNSFLTNDAFEQGRDRLFDTIIEYSAIELDSDIYWKHLIEENQRNMEKDKKNRKIKKVSSSALVNEDIILLLEKEKSLKPYHKYIAFVKADGDHLTDTITKLKKQGRSVAELDKCLLEYNLNIIKLIESNDYQGKAIFLGGDDLLFFAPVRNGEKNIFTLLQEINTAFNTAMKDLPAPPTLSFGVSISYYKYPMFEAIDKAEKLLQQAKDAGRNSIAWYLRKHSGQVCQSIINKKYAEVYAQCTELINHGMISKYSSENLLNSFTYWLMENKAIIMHILEPLQSDSVTQKEDKIIKKTLLDYFNNSFNEPQHDKMKTYMETLVQYLISTTKAINRATTEAIDKAKADANIKKITDEKDKQKEYAIDSLCAILRFVRFLKSEQP